MSENGPEIDSNLIYEILGGIYIQLLRIYDVLCVANKDNPDISGLVSLHESGKVLSPDPALILDDE